MTGALTADRIVAAWETGATRAPLDRAIAMLWASGMTDGAEDLPIADRDRHLLHLRLSTFGPDLNAVANCPTCETAVEVTLDAADLVNALVAPDTDVVDIAGTPVHLRPMTSRDLAAAAQVEAGDIPAFLRHRLTDAHDLADTDARDIEALIETRETGAGLTIALICPDCTHGWSEPLDVAAHVWAEIETAAYKTLSDVAEIAAAFGWSEGEILAMSTTRRATYLRIARGG